MTNKLFRTFPVRLTQWYLLCHIQQSCFSVWDWQLKSLMIPDPLRDRLSQSIKHVLPREIYLCLSDFISQHGSWVVLQIQPEFTVWCRFLPSVRKMNIKSIFALFKVLVFNSFVASEFSPHQIPLIMLGFFHQNKL